MKSLQQGFTLIELMISLTLGLLISAVAVQLFITGQISFNLQQGSADVQDSGLFGMEVMARSIRAANYNNSSAIINDRTAWGGIVFTSDQNDDPVAGDIPGNLEALKLGGSYVKDTLLTRGAGQTIGTGNEWTGASNVTLSTGGALASDQLVIQYQAHEDTFDCEGQVVRGPRRENVVENGVTINKALRGDYVIERYFLRPDNMASASEPNQPLALACDAGRYTLNDQQKILDNTEEILNYGDAGQILMNRVDHFHVLLGSTDTAGQQIYYTIQNYMAIPVASRLRITSIKAAVLSRSANNTGSNQLNVSQDFSMFDQTVKVKSATNNKYVRQVYGATVALRNGMGDRQS